MIKNIDVKKVEKEFSKRMICFVCKVSHTKVIASDEFGSGILNYHELINFKYHSK